MRISICALCSFLLTFTFFAIVNQTAAQVDKKDDKAIDQKEGKGIAAVVEGYLGAKNVEGRLPFIMDPEKNRKPMETRNKESQFNYSSISVTSISPIKGHLDGFEVKASFKMGEQTATPSYFVRRTKDGFKIDWAASVGHNDFPLVTYFETNPKEPKTFRVSAELGSLYAGEFADHENAYYNLDLRESVPPETCWGYVVKESDAGKKIFEILKDGNKHKITVELQLVTPSGKAARFHTCTITKLVSETWFTPAEKVEQVPPK